jgi:hypothetical protein
LQFASQEAPASGHRQSRPAGTQGRSLFSFEWEAGFTALSRRHNVGRLAFAGRVLPDATLRGMRMSRSHGGTVPIVFDWNLSSEASSPGSDASCRKRRAGRGADTPAILTFASAPLPRGRLRLVTGRWPRATGLTS